MRLQEQAKVYVIEFGDGSARTVAKRGGSAVFDKMPVMNENAILGVLVRQTDSLDGYVVYSRKPSVREYAVELGATLAELPDEAPTLNVGEHAYVLKMDFDTGKFIWNKVVRLG